MKVLYTFGEAVASNTELKKGEFIEEEENVYIKDITGHVIQIKNVEKIENYWTHEMDYYIKIKMRKTKTLILIVPTLVINPKTNFMLSSGRKTKKLKTILESKIV